MMNTDKTLILGLALACVASPVMAADAPRGAATTQTADVAPVAAPQAARVRVKDRASAAAAVAAARAAGELPAAAIAPVAPPVAAAPGKPADEPTPAPAPAAAPVAATPAAAQGDAAAPDVAQAPPVPEPVIEPELVLAAECNPPFKSEVAALFDRWNASLRSGDPKKVVAHYAPGAVLLPTVSNRARFTVAEKEEYFAHFLKRRPEGRVDDRVIEVDCNSASDSGLYTFRFADGTQVKARYTFIWKRVDGEWLIASHHSSGMPEKTEPAADPAAPRAAASATARPVQDTTKTWVRFP